MDCDQEEGWFIVKVMIVCSQSLADYPFIWMCIATPWWAGWQQNLHCVGVDLSHGSSPRLLLCGSGRIKHFSGKNPRTPLSHPSTPPHSPYFPDPPLKASTSTKGYKDEVQQPTKSTSLPKNGEKSWTQQAPPAPQVPPYLCVSVPLAIGSERAAIPVLVLTSADQDKLLNASLVFQVSVLSPNF